jgi:hypothetical protein
MRAERQRCRESEVLAQMSSNKTDSMISHENSECHHASVHARMDIFSTIESRDRLGPPQDRVKSNRTAETTLIYWHADCHTKGFD